MSTATASSTGFAQFGLAAPLNQAIERSGYEIPTPIQVQIIPHLLAGRDLLGQAQTGTGKTAAFTLPMLQLLNRYKPEKRTIRSLVLVPTRELAAQVEECVCDYGQNLDLKALCIFGGVPINPQLKALKHGIDILVATPGRLIDHLGRGTVKLSNVEISLH